MFKSPEAIFSGINYGFLFYVHLKENEAKNETEVDP